ncbi:MAG TPA: glycosyltransferase [Candidatus Saccharimonadales bacterium]|nr:glycosyltransferase [Candidatus Saccharimonadales bacterium]
MAPAFLVFAAATLLELMLWLSVFWKIRKPFTVFLCLALGLSGASMVVLHPIFATILLFFVTAYRIVNLLRIIKDRADEKYLYRKVSSTGAYLITAQGIIVLAWMLTQLYHLTSTHFWTLFSIIQLAGIIVVVASTERHLRTTRPPQETGNYTDKELPTLTVAIPARNETEDLEQCLASLIASDYPKLEIIVLDDCSQNARTPEIIRSFAHDGVRFLAGEDTREHWLAKNQAYQQLLDAANGDVIMFAGVDSRYQPQSLRRLVGAMLHKNKTMMSIIPKNVVLPAAEQDESILLQPARYAWELSLPRKMFNRPSVLSTCWLVDKKMLQSAGGFAAVSRSIVPESYFARVSAVHDGYSFMQSNEYIGITSSKAAPDQFNTAVRTRYPQLHRRPELVFALTLCEAFGFILPFLFLAAHLFGNWRTPGTALSLLTCLLMLYFYGRIVALTYRKFLLRGFVSAPFAAIMDIIVLNYSMAKYEFDEVIWKGRNVCIPVMHVVPALPEIETRK